MIFIGYCLGGSLTLPLLIKEPVGIYSELILDLILNLHLTASVPVPKPSLKQITEEVMTDMNFADNTVNQNTTFHLVRSDTLAQPRAYGSIANFFTKKIIILVPEFFNVEEETDVKELVFFRVFSDVSVPELVYDPTKLIQVKQLKAATVLSQDAKKFAIAREFLRGTSSDAKYQSALAIAHLLANYLICRRFNTNFKLFQRAVKIRLLQYFSVSLLNFMLYMGTSSSLRVNNEYNLDDQAARINEAYAKGGVELYAKEKERLLAQRDLLPGGNRLINLKGDLQSWTDLFQKKMSIDKRIEICRNIIPLHGAGLN